MKPVYHAWDLGMLDPETVEVMKSSKQVFNRNMARYLLGEMTTIFVEHGAVNLDCMYELSRMTLDDAKYFLSESPKVESGDLPVAKCFMECAGDTMAKEIFVHVQRIARSYISDCTYLSIIGNNRQRGTRQVIKLEVNGDRS